MEGTRIPAVEFACTANYGRSPVAEFIANNYIREIEAEDKIRAISSGTSAADIVAGNMLPYEVMEKFVNKGLERGDQIYNETDRQFIENAKKGREEGDAAHLHVMKLMYDKATAIFQAEESEHRAHTIDRLVKEAGMTGYVKAHQDQTVPREDVVAILAATPSNTERAREIYGDSRPNPIIETLSAYATENPEAQMEDAFGSSDPNAYHNNVVRMEKEVPMAIDRLVRELES